MVDATTGHDAPRVFARTGKPADGAALPFSARVDAGADVSFGSDSIIAPPQHPQWIAAWTEEVNSDILVASLADAGGQQVLALPLEVVSAGGLKIARFVGGSHANGNFPVMRPGNQAISRAALDELANAIHRQRPDIDVLALERMAEELNGVRNPLLAMPSQVSPNVALALDLRGGFDAVLERSPSRKGRRYRAQARKFELFGGAHRLIAGTEHDVMRFLDAFFAMKAERFRAMGITDVFAEPKVQAFFRHLFVSSLGSGAFSLAALEVGGKLRAVTGHSRCGDRLICEFGAIANDQMAMHSPGDFLFYENIKEACEETFLIYDFSVGDEPYKRAWCDIELRQADVVVPLTTRGRIFSRWLNAKSSLKGHIKSNAVIWPLAKRLRRLVRGQ